MAKNMIDRVILEVNMPSISPNLGPVVVNLLKSIHSWDYTLNFVTFI